MEEAKTWGRSGAREATPRWHHSRRGAGAFLGMSRRVRQKLRNGLLFTAPWTIGTLVFTVYPIVASLYYSFTDYSVLAPARWVGVTNYERLFLKDERFYTALKNTMAYAVMLIPTSLVLGIGIAVLLNLRLRGVGIYRAAIYLPTVIPAVASSVVWMWLLDPQYGVANDVLRRLGLPTIGWLSDPRWAKPSLVFISCWGLGTTIIVYLAGLQDVPASLYEAAELDGAGTLNRFRHVTLPMLSPTIFFNLVMTLIGTFGYFTTVYVLTRGSGGPVDSTLVYSLLLYNNAFVYYKMGYASAMAWILFIIVSAVTFIVFRSSGKWVYYGGGA
jgi:multiple sugar transport system permease protein